MEKYSYDQSDFKEIERGGMIYRLCRIVALRDIHNPRLFVKAGEKGGYVFPDGLSQEGESWVDQGSVIGPQCEVAGNALVQQSYLGRNVVVKDNAVVTKSTLEFAPRGIEISGRGRVVSSYLQGNIRVSGEAAVVRSKMFGNINVFGIANVYDCNVESNSTLEIANREYYVGKTILAQGNEHRGVEKRLGR
ncbi:MAG: hypothetical protein E7375_02655 [Clostridiales bacterium]|nr:hypothetical protein [Clostridiales bacterium]